MADWEVWRPVVGYELSYEVSTEGRVRSLDRVDTNGRTRRGVILVNLIGSSGYPQVNLHYGGHQETRHVHRLVIEAFGTEPKDGEEVRHMNGNPLDNSIANLAWGTHLENMHDQQVHGTHKNSVKTHCPAGHPYDGDNLVIQSNGNRKCAVCRRESWRRTSARRTAERKTA